MKKVKFLSNFRFAENGVNIVEYKKDQEAIVSDDCADMAGKLCKVLEDLPNHSNKPTVINAPYVDPNGTPDEPSKEPEADPKALAEAKAKAEAEAKKKADAEAKKKAEANKS